jgi:hypothetical protein
MHLPGDERPIGGYDEGTEVRARLVPRLGERVRNINSCPEDKTIYSIKVGDTGKIVGWFGLKAWYVKFDSCPVNIACYPHEIEPIAGPAQINTPLVQGICFAILLIIAVTLGAMRPYSSPTGFCIAPQCDHVSK